MKIFSGLIAKIIAYIPFIQILLHLILLYLKFFHSFFSFLNDFMNSAHYIREHTSGYNRKENNEYFFIYSERHEIPIPYCPHLKNTN